MENDFNWYSVALSYQRNNQMLLRLISVKSRSIEEALGRAITEVEANTGAMSVKNATLSNHCVQMQEIQPNPDLYPDLDGQEFYELMQAYRHAEDVDSKASKAFHRVLEYLDISDKLHLDDSA